MTILNKSPTFVLVKHGLLIAFLFFAGCTLAQKPAKIKRKFFGNYSGVLPPYKFDSGKELIHVDSTSIQVRIADSTVELSIGKNQLKGTYNVMFESNDYYFLNCTIEGQVAGERMLLYKKGKKICRLGINPQPNAILHRYKVNKGEKP